MGPLYKHKGVTKFKSKRIKEIGCPRMSLFPIPRGVVKKTNKLRRGSFWRGTKEKKCYNLVKWNLLILSTTEVCFKNGYGDSAMKTMPCGKIHIRKVWRNESMDHQRCTQYLWLQWQKTIRKLWSNYTTNISIRVGNGKTEFWNDLWLGQATLKDQSLIFTS